MKTLLLLFAIAACNTTPKKPPPTPKGSCGASCNSNLECGQDILKTCPYCNFGTCRSVRPEAPTVDAGTDASTKGPKS
jgi:hypothetical protein